MNKKNKIFCFVQLYHISERGGGAEVQAGYLSKELVSRGFNVYYICQTINVNKEGTTSLIDGVNIYWIPLKASLSISNILKIKTILKKIKPNYIIERMSSSYGLPIILVKRKIHSKYIWICTDNKSPEAFAKVKEFYKKLPFLNFILTIHKSLVIDMIRWIANRKADIVFSQNGIQKKLIQLHFNRESSRMISGHPLPSKSITIPERFDNKTILWCANLGDHKRPELFIELASKMEHTNLKFVMVGGHANKNYEQQLFENKLKNLTNTGRLNFDNALNYFDQATIFVNTSSPGGDGFPNTYVQAWLRSIPVFNFGFDPDDIIVNNNLGFSLNSIDDAIEKISTVMADYDVYKILAKNTYNYGCQNHSIKVMTDNFLNNIENRI